MSYKDEIKSLARFKIVSTKELLPNGLLFKYSNLLTETGSFILDLTKNIGIQKNVQVTEYPTYLEGKKKIKQVVKEPITISVSGKLSYYTSVIRKTINLSLFQEMLETIIDNALILDVETETRSYYNFIITQMSISHDSIGSISIDLSLREVWLVSSPKVTSLTNYTKEQSLIENKLLKMDSFKEELKRITNRIKPPVRTGSSFNSITDIVQLFEVFALLENMITVAKTYDEAGRITDGTYFVRDVPTGIFRWDLQDSGPNPDLNPSTLTNYYEVENRPVDIADFLFNGFGKNIYYPMLDQAHEANLENAMSVGDFDILIDFYPVAKPTTDTREDKLRAQIAYFSAPYNPVKVQARIKKKTSTQYEKNITKRLEWKQGSYRKYFSSEPSVFYNIFKFKPSNQNLIINLDCNKFILDENYGLLYLTHHYAKNSSGEKKRLELDVTYITPKGFSCILNAILDKLNEFSDLLLDLGYTKIMFSSQLQKFLDISKGVW